MVNNFKLKFFSRLLGRFINIALGFLTVGIVPRSLGSHDYGIYSFITFFFTRLLKFLKFGTNEAFFTFLSKNQKRTKLIVFFAFFIVLVSVLVNIFILTCFVFNLNNYIWSNTSLTCILIASSISLFAFLNSSMRDISDIYNKTIKTELFLIVLNLIYVVILISMFKLNYVNIKSVLLLQLFNMILILSIYLFVLSKVLYSNLKLPSLKNIFFFTKRFYIFSHPLFITLLLGFVCGVCDRWILNYSFGEIQHGLYALSLKISSLLSIIVVSFTALYKKYLIELLPLGNSNQTRSFVKKSIYSVYFIVAYPALFILVYSSEFSLIIGGQTFIEASSMVSIMCLYALGSVYSYLGNSILLVYEDTILIRNVTIFSRLLGIPLSFILITPYFGFFGLGGLGLSLKMFITQLITINIIFYFVTRMLSLNYFKYICHQIIIVFIFYSFASFTKNLSFYSDLKLFPMLLFSFSCYTILILFFVFIFPYFTGFTKEEIANNISSLTKKIYAKI